MAINDSKKRDPRYWKKWNDSGSIGTIPKLKATPKTNTDFLWEGVALAQKNAREEGIAIGKVIAHPKDDFSYELREIKDSIAITFRPNPEGEGEIVKEFSLHEIFDVNLANRLAKELKFKHEQTIVADINKRANGSAGIIMFQL